MNTRTYLLSLLVTFAAAASVTACDPVDASSLAPDAARAPAPSGGTAHYACSGLSSPSVCKAASTCRWRGTDQFGWCEWNGKQLPY